MKVDDAIVGAAVQARFRAALDGLVERLREDRAVLAAILGGSLSHDTVWARSDIDLVLVTIDDRKAQSDGIALDADGVNVHAILVSRAELRRAVEGSLHHSFMHSFLAKGRLLYTHDETIVDLLARLQDIGERDTAVQLLRAAAGALLPVYKAHKWLLTRGDLHYTALWILYAATPLAQVEVISHRVLVDREVIPQATALNPAFFGTIYTDLLDRPKRSPRSTRTWPSARRGCSRPCWSTCATSARRARAPRSTTTSSATWASRVSAARASTSPTGGSWGARRWRRA
jgi:uncharacterized protein